MKIVALLHVTFLIADVGRSRAFYEGILGLTENPDRPDLGFPGVWYDLGKHQQIHLMQLPSPDAGQQRPVHGGRDRHAALAVRDIAALRIKLKEAGILWTQSKSGRPALFCRDPDGNALEFVEHA